MTGVGRGEAWGSALSADEFAAIGGIGFEPAGQVFGAAVYPLGVTAAVSCPGPAVPGGRRPASPRAAGPGLTIVSGQGIPGPVARLARALYDGRRTAVDRMTAECADLGGHGIVGASVQVREIPAEVRSTGAVEFTVLGTAVRARGCPPLARPFACDLSGQDFARLIMAGWVPAGIVLGISVAARHDDLLTSDRSRWGAGNTEVAAYTDLIVAVRQDARSQLERALRRLGADGVVVSAMTSRVHGDACRAHPGGTDHVAEVIITGTAVVRFADRSRTFLSPSLAVLLLNDRR
jgi:uncharacterized protein YbjQ (UPF0145 family)